MDKFGDTLVLTRYNVWRILLESCRGSDRRLYNQGRWQVMHCCSSEEGMEGKK